MMEWLSIALGTCGTEAVHMVADRRQSVQTRQCHQGEDGKAPKHVSVSSSRPHVLKGSIGLKKAL